jgi:hypothetical protein
VPQALVDLPLTRSRDLRCETVKTECGAAEHAADSRSPSTPPAGV